MAQPPSATTISPSSSQEQLSLTYIVVIATLMALSAILSILLFLYLRRVKRTRKLLADVHATGPPLPVHYRQQAEEVFDRRYADIFGDRALCRQQYDERRVCPSHLLPTGVTLGAGMFSHVVLAHFAASSTHIGWNIVGRQSTGNAAALVAVKELRIEAGHEAAVLAQVLLEARLLAAMDHPHLIRLVAVSDLHLPLRLALEYCPEGDLRRFLREGRNSVLLPRPDVGCLTLAFQMASAVQYLHSKLCIHRDLAARNVLLQVAPSNPGAASSTVDPSISSCGFVAKLADLGLSRVLQSSDDYYRVRRLKLE